VRRFAVALSAALLGAVAVGSPLRAAQPSPAVEPADAPLAEVPDFTCADAGRPHGEARAFRTRLAGVPAIVRTPSTVTKPPIILWHGYAAPASEAELMRALPLDETPAIKVYLGLPLFGARAPAAGQDSVADRQQQDFALRLFKPVVMGAAAELPAVVKDLRRRRCLTGRQKIGLFGFSAGGTSALVALADHEAPISTVVTVNAPTGLTPSVEAMERATHQPFTWSQPARDVARQADVAARPRDVAQGRPPPALLLIHGADDTVVTPQGAVALQQALAPAYRRGGDQARLAVEILPQVPHNWTDSTQLALLRGAIANWFNRYL
jgi:dienelactone hydrolase